MATYIKNGEYSNGKKIMIDGKWVFNPSEEQLAQAGWSLVTPPAPSVPTAAQRREARIWELKERLAESDYKTLKYVEGWISEQDYSPIKAERQALRDEINRLESMTDAEYREAEEPLEEEGGGNDDEP